MAGLFDRDPGPYPPVLGADRLRDAGYHKIGEYHGHLRQAYRDLRVLQQTMAVPGPALGRTGRWRCLTPPQLRDLNRKLDQTARSENLRLCATTPLPRPPVRRRLPRSRIICDRRLIETRDGDLGVWSLAQHHEVRVGSQLGLSLRIVDGAHIVVGPTSADERSGAHLRSPRMAASLRQLFDLLWDEAMPVRPSIPPAPLTQAQWRVLQLAALGLDDPTLAGVTGTTVKTVRTHVAALCAVLGVSTRFAAGAEAAARGWLF